MTSKNQRMQRTGSAIFAFAAVGLILCAILWPPSVAQVLHSRLGAVLLAIWGGGFAVVLHPELGAGLAQGIREFWKAMKEFNGDGDDGPLSA